jgi:hypothetical protein
MVFYLLHSIQTSFDAHPVPVPSVPRAFLCRSIDQDVKLTTHLHLVQRLEIHGAILPLPHIFCERVQGQLM